MPTKILVSVRQICLRVAFIAGVASIMILSLLPERSLPSFEVSDKLEHLIAYALVALVAGLAFPTQGTMLTLMILLSGLSVILELGQYFVPGRSPEIADAMASSAGACIVLFLLHFLRLALARARRHKRARPATSSPPAAGSALGRNVPGGDSR